MKRNIKHISGFNIGATDGEIGKVREFYFDDHTWTIRYLIVDTAGWLSGRRVLISPEAFLNLDWEGETFYLNLSKEQIENSPDINTDMPVSKQEELRLNQYYPWKKYWEGGLWSGGMGMGTTGMVLQSAASEEDVAGERINREQNTGDHNLRSTAQMLGYNIRAKDDMIGDIKDFIVDDVTWKIDFIVVDTGNWLPGKKVLISPAWVERIEWELSVVYLNTKAAQVKNSPEYNPDEIITDDYMQQLHEHYSTTHSSIY